MTTYIIVIVVIALVFDYINGFHDAANSIATIVSTRVLSPRTAVIWAAAFNFIAFALFEPTVARNIAKGVEPAFITPNVILGSLLGAIIWNLLTWWWGLPSSSSHALMGGFAGAAVKSAGRLSVLDATVFGKTAAFILVSPLLGAVIGFSLMHAIRLLASRWTPGKVSSRFRRLQLLSAAAYSLGHGGNDAQKTMGIITALLIAAGVQANGEHPEPLLWVVLTCHAAMGLGTLSGGWRIVKTMGMRITKLKPVGGFAAETAGAVTLFSATALGIPVSTTHTITGAIVGVGATSGRVSTVRWGVAGRIVWAWIFTIPAAALLSATVYTIVSAISGVP
ncbi:inorganic phosphate transporter [Sorangium cellulosum]|uniref:Inorganic phosphate transporter n=1 Tax=Sorangium cellulosum TaxID=56 RepID=A0A2L0ETX7_SORCE|nr:inorganic phosphate transporter [Sorangium cellulosum]AUX42729.1 inorganic phosphate transporter [Sorangium cellulosum]